MVNINIFIFKTFIMIMIKKYEKSPWNITIINNNIDKDYIYNLIYKLNVWFLDKVNYIKLVIDIYILI